MKIIAALFLFSSAGFGAYPAPTVANLFTGQISIIEGEIVSLAEAMPADRYDFRPTAGEFKTVRTFAQQAKHVAAVNYMCAGAALGQKPPVDIGKGENGPDSVATKEQIVQFLKDSYAFTHKAAQTMTEKSQVEQVPSPFGQDQMMRGAAALCPSWHGFDHYGQMVVYARMNSIIPPASK